MSMDESVRIAKFSVLVDEICDLVSGGGLAKSRVDSVIPFELRLSVDFKRYHLDPSLLFVFDYDKLNKFAQIIMEKCPINAGNWSEKQWRENSHAEVSSYRDIKDSVRKIKEFVKQCREDRYEGTEYIFIFWSLMILAVDKTEEDKHISLICNFAKLFDITDKEIQDMIYIVKLIFNKVDSDYEFQSDTIVEIFGKVLTKYNCEL